LIQGFLARSHLVLNAVVTDVLNPSKMKAEASQHLSSANSGDAQSATVEILDHPFSFEGEVQQRRTDRATDMRSPFTPVHTGVGETTS